MATPGDTMAPGLSVGKVNAPATRATGSKGKAFTKWKPRPMPKPDPEDYVIVLKPRERVSLHEVLTETGYGTAISAYLEPERARAISVLPSRDQNIIIVHTPDIEATDRLIGDFVVNTEKDSIPLQERLLWKQVQVNFRICGHRGNKRPFRGTQLCTVGVEAYAPWLH
ncbi:hypothetical protein IscW_ISCW013372 [Ixodes scapularis]|uniref:Uncharacterized protein n=1 Tax=Ixodes scapularis TaxID=6945 RepID=B7QED0_IXOSC|nr:hypothetical protein IscW_ISCW013372 [Ixodes scapularis]|eukprot:XP_002413894.1 hypothetical protein IscW_ISCW013372 [Ixodes scapularis]